MRFSRRYALAILLPPLALLLPVALLFLNHVTRIPIMRLLPAAAFLYVVGVAAAAIVLSRVATESDEAVSTALATTALVSAALWLGWGSIIAMIGSALFMPTFLGIQYFGEAAMIVAAPAMAWSYWAGKRLLLDEAGDGVVYTGRTWSVGMKIAMVFIGFFIVSAGALVLVISSRVGARLGDEAAYEVARFGVLMALGTTVVFALATWFLARDISRPMNALVQFALELAEGRFENEARVFSDDEIGVLARSLGRTRNDLKTLVARVGNRGGTIADGVRLMSLGTESLLDGASEQTAIAEESTASLNHVRNEAESVLHDVQSVTELTYDAAGRSTELRASFAEVSRRSADLFQSVEKSSSAANEIEAAARETAQRTNELSGISTDVLAFVSEMDVTVEQITKTAQSTAALSTQVRDHAVTGREAVDATMIGIRSAQESTQRTSGAFESLQKSLGQIDQILVFIDDVTNRTNLLSLNAAIIAAQAGGEDFGFSVIADEVRQLADRTRSATKEIAGIIRSVQPVARQAVEALSEGVRNVDRTVDLAHNASEALGTILQSADRSLEMTQSISKALQEQAQASRHLHRVTEKMSENIAEIHRATQGQADATRMLATEAERVSDIARQVERATVEQTEAGEGIARAMEQIANDVSQIRDRLERQLQHADQIASASKITLSIAERNGSIAEQFSNALQTLLHQGQEFESEVARFRS